MPTISSDFDFGVPFKVNHKIGGSEYYQPSPLDSFLIQEVGANGLCCICRDVNILLNQERIRNSGLDSAVNDILSRVRTSDISDRFSHLSDSELTQCIKSRYIQAPSELLDWSAYLESQLCKIEAAAAEAAQFQQQDTQGDAISSADSGGSSE